MKKTMQAVLYALASCALLAGCGGGGEPGEVRVTMDLGREASEWRGGYADYSEQTVPEDVVIAGAPVPAPATGTALYMAGRNRSDDLFLFAKRRWVGLVPNTHYQLTFSVTFLTNAPTGCAGVGGGPDSVWLKAGASATEPTAIKVDTDIVMNIDKGIQSEGGANAVVLGDIGNTSTDCENLRYESKALTSSQPVVATTDSDGALWFFVGIDSGFESATAVYLRSVDVDLKPSNQAPGEVVAPVKAGGGRR